MLRYPTNIMVKTRIGGSQLLPCDTPRLPPTAYVVLTRETGFESEQFDDKLNKRIVDAAEAQDKDYVILG